MRPETSERLLALNRGFYQRFARAFVSKRPRLQPGAARVLGRVAPGASVLDLGCGHGLLAAALHDAGHRGRYVGLDSSPDLLRRAQEQGPPEAAFLLADLAADWPKALVARGEKPFLWIFALAVVHHLPSEGLRASLMERIRSWLLPDGTLIVSAWDFLSSPRWRGRIQPWPSVGLAAADVDAEDYLLDWREGGAGIRYVHHFTEESLAALGAQAGFRVAETYRSDGEGGRLGLYQVWRR